MTGRRGVVVGLVVAVAQTVALAAASIVTSSSALRTQTVTNLADVAVGVFLLIGVLAGDRPADDTHPLGYGRDRFFWSFIAAIGIFVGGFGAAVLETVQTALEPRDVSSFAVGYAVLVVVIGLDAVALVMALTPLREHARDRRVRLVRLLWHGSDPAVTTVVLSSAAGLIGGVIAIAGLVAADVSGQTWPDVVASGAIGVVLLATSVVLLHTNRELLTGRALPQRDVTEMRAVILGHVGIVSVPDIFAIVVGPGSVIVDGDVVFDDDLDVPEVESIIVSAAAALRAAWPSIAYVYLNPVSGRRPRRAVQPSA